MKMKLGILNSLDSQEREINWQGSAVSIYIRLFETVQAPFEYVGYEVAQGELPESPDACDAYLITGSPTGVYDDEPWIMPLSDFIRACYRQNKRLVGICFGHQILAEALGGHVEKSEKGKGLGLKTFAINATKPWMSEPSSQCALYFVHQDQVIDLPPEAELLGGNAFCPNALYTINNRVLGIQGHPEFTHDLMEKILAAHDKQTDPEVHATAVASLNNGMPDNQRMATWIVNFLTADILH